MAVDWRLTVCVLFIAALSGVHNARPGDDPPWLKWLETLTNTGRDENDSASPQIPQSFGQNDRDQRGNNFGQVPWQQPFGGNPPWQSFGQPQRPQRPQRPHQGQSGQNQFGQRPTNQYGETQRPPYGQRPPEQESGVNQRPTQQFGQTQRPTHEEQYVGRPLRPGDACTRENRPGKCTYIYECQEVMASINNNKPPPRPCYISPKDSAPYVCCLSSTGGGTGTSRPSTKPSTPRPQTTNKPAPIKKKSIAHQKCLEYAQLVYVTEPSPALLAGPDVQVDKCFKSGEGLIVGGIEAILGEFPHMALLGYGDAIQSLAYECGGSLISEDFVLTAAHCMQTKVPTYARVGDLIISSDFDGAKHEIIAIAERIPHPMYKWPSNYFDIALVRLQNRPILTPNLRPACLHTGAPIGDNALTASGWGVTEFAGDPSDALMKVSLKEIDFERCNRTYGSMGSKLSNGILTDQQICAGRLEGGKDTCQGDSGGPLQMLRTEPHCTYDIVGVVSFGKGCAFRNTPGVYARVQHFVGWIEEKVWPSGA